ncbi:MAG: dihydroxyacetone kinase subunit L [Halobacteriales archaeon SW_8_66_22]|nr:MAG: dihydroxyacetone kinase subunit L [Halobacteriales archaeon SW_8_66_22]
MVDEHEQTAAVLDAVDAIADRIDAETDHLTDLDSAVGDADHGANMSRGFAAARDQTEDMDDASPADAVKTVGTALISEVGGASGPLYGGSIMKASAVLDDGLTEEATIEFAETYLETVQDRGDARPGDKTMVDALVPAVHTYRKSIEEDDLPPLTALSKAVDAAERGVNYTVPLRARKGRASYLGWRSVGHQDPGATSTLYILEELLDVAAEHLDGEVDRDAISPTIPDEDLEEE